jgi:hypothetical protein
MKSLYQIILIIILFGCQSKKAESNSNPLLDSLISSAENQKITLLSKSWPTKNVINYRIKTKNIMTSSELVYKMLNNRPSELIQKEYLGKIIEYKNWYIVPIYYEKKDINNQGFVQSYLIKNKTNYINCVLSW